MGNGAPRKESHNMKAKLVWAGVVAAVALGALALVRRFAPSVKKQYL